MDVPQTSKTQHVPNHKLFPRNWSNYSFSPEARVPVFILKTFFSHLSIHLMNQQVQLILFSKFFLSHLLLFIFAHQLSLLPGSLQQQPMWSLLPILLSSNTQTRMIFLKCKPNHIVSNHNIQNFHYFQAFSGKNSNSFVALSLAITIIQAYSY